MDTTVVSPLLTEWEARKTQPFTLIGDDVVVGILLLCFLIVAIALADKSHYLHQLMYNYSVGHTRAQSDNIRTSRSFYLRSTLLLQSFFSASLIFTYYQWSKGYVSDSAQCLKYLLMGVIAAAVYVIAKTALFFAVNNTLYSKQQAGIWTQIFGDTCIFAGIVFYLFAVACISFEVPSSFVEIGIVILFSLAEIWLIFKSFHIFFVKKYGVLQLFIYFCTLEFIPLLVLGKILRNLGQIF